MQDSETGEICYLPPLALKHVTFDEETGEPQCNNNRKRTWDYDDETGEPINQIKGRSPKAKFSIPREYLMTEPDVPKNKCILKDCTETFTLTDRSKAIHLKEEIILGYNKTNHRMFLIPSLFLFFKLTAVFLAVSELMLHIWAHRKNSRNTNENVYYRSPLHILTSQFCAVCRSQNDFDHINKLQARTRRLHENLTHVSRSLS